MRAYLPSAAMRMKEDETTGAALSTTERELLITYSNYLQVTSLIGELSGTAMFILAI